MGYTDDWEKILNGAFGPGGRPRFGGTKPAAPAAEAPARGTAENTPQPGGAGENTPAAPGPESAEPAETAAARPQKPVGDSLDEMMQLLQAQQKALDEKLRAQTRAIQGEEKARQALADSRRMIREMESDGLLAPGTSQVPPAQQGSFEGLAARVKEDVLGQDAFVDSLVRALRRPFVQGSRPGRAKNVILLTGRPGTGRHYALRCAVREMAARGLVQSEAIADMDLALYQNPGAEKLFLQDLYAALHAPGEVLCFAHYESCHPAFLRVLSDLAVKGSAPLSTRYMVKNDILVDAGTALVPGAVGSLEPCGKYLVFFSEKGRAALADLCGAAMAGAVGDVCETGPFAPESLRALAARVLNRLAEQAKARLGLTCTADAAVRDWVADQYDQARGAAALTDAGNRLLRALGEFCLSSETPAGRTVALTVQDGAPFYAVDGGEARPLLDLLPAADAGGVAAVQKEMDEIVGLTDLKQYVLGLADNVRVQQRRAAAGLKTASLSMHMIFTGNPGTGKTTIARLVARYLKAIGALKGGQLVEVTRGDLVGRYSGHTAPLTESVIQSALGGVLFIDEAYSLYRGEQDSFGLEAIDTLVKGMEDHRDELVVILAGYTKEMEQFLSANSGLASRFPNRVEFPDYTGEELLQITKLQAGAKGYRLAPDCEAPLLAYYTARQAADAAQAGNGRLARNTLEKAILNQSRRLVAEPEAPLDELLRSDFELDLPESDTPAAQAAQPEPEPPKKGWFW